MSFSAPYLVDILLPGCVIGQSEAVFLFDNHPISNFADLATGIDGLSFAGESPQMVDPEVS